jgi:D-amino acid aminotransferase
MTSHIWHNGNLVPADQPVFGAFDPGLQFGEGVFETIRIYDGRPFLARDHLERMRRNGAALGLGIAITPDEFDAAIAQLVHATGILEGRLKAIATPGNQVPGAEVPKPTFTVTLQAVDDYPEHFFTEGVEVRFFPWNRTSDNPIPHLKTLSYLENAWVRKKVQSEGAFEGVFLTDTGMVAEGTRSNFFVVRDGEIHTAPTETNILPGITRQTTIRLARENQIPVIEEPFTADFARAADEAFLTSTICEVLPVTAIDRKPVGDGAVGQITRTLMKAFTGYRSTC